MRPSGNESMKDGWRHPSIFFLFKAEGEPNPILWVRTRTGENSREPGPDDETIRVADKVMIQPFQLMPDDADGKDLAGNQVVPDFVEVTDAVAVQQPDSFRKDGNELPKAD